MSNDSSNRAHIAALRARDRADGQVQFRFNARVLVGSALLGALVLGAVVTSPPQIQADTEYGVAAFTSFLLSDMPSDPLMTIAFNGQVDRTGVKEWAIFQPLRHEAVSFARTLGLGGVLGFAGGTAGLWLTGDRRRRKQEERLADRVMRGTRVANETTLADITTEKSDEPRLQFGDIILPSGLETRHIALIGTTGGGKTTALRQQLDVIEARGEAALVYDTSGEFVANYYDPARGDIILNPFDQRGTFWSPFAEIIHPADASRIANYLIHETGDEERDIWLEASRNLVANVMRNLWREGRGTLQALLDALQSMPRTELEHWLANTSSARTFEKNADRATASVLFMLVKAVNMLMFLRKSPQGGEEAFSISQFFKGIDQHKGRKPWIFVPRQEDFFEAMKPLMALWLEAAASAMLGLPASSTRRVWFLLDELADLPRVENLERLLPQGRKFGACAILSFQTIGQMRGHYGPDGADALLGCCNTKLFLQMSDHASREWASATIGSVEVEVPTLAEMFDPKTGKPQRTLSTTRELRAAVLESDLRLPKHTGYLLLPDGLPVARIKLTNNHIIARGPARQSDFIPADVSETLWGGLQEAQVAKTPDTPIKGTILGPGPV